MLGKYDLNLCGKLWEERMEKNLASYSSKYEAFGVFTILVDAIEQLILDPEDHYIIPVNGMSAYFAYFINTEEGRRIVKLIGFETCVKQFEMKMVLRPIDESARHYAWLLAKLREYLELAKKKKERQMQAEKVRIYGDQKRLERVRMLIEDDKKRKRKETGEEPINTFDLRAFRKEIGPPKIKKVKIYFFI